MIKPSTETREPRHVTSPHLSPEPHRIVDTDGCQTWLRQQMCTRRARSKSYVFQHFTHHHAACYKSVTRVVCNFWIGTKGVWTIRCNYHQSSITSQCTNHLSTCSQFNYDRIINYIQNMVDIKNAVSQSYHPVLDIHITSQRVTWITAVSGFMARTLNSPCLPNAYKRWQKTFNSENLPLKLEGPETSRLLRLQMYPSQLDSLRPEKSENATKGSRHQQ